MRWRMVALFWGGLMAVIGLAGLLIFGFFDPEPIALFGGTVAVMVLLAALLALRRWDHLDEEFLRSHPDVSPPVPLLGVSCGLLAYSLEVGWWLSLIAGGMTVLGLGGLIREKRAERRALRVGRGQGALARRREESA